MFRFLSALLALALPGLAHAAPCTATAEVQHVHTLRDSLAALPEPEALGGIVPGTERLVPALREALAAAITRILQCEAVTLTDPAAIQADLAGRLQANRPASPPPQLGDDLRFHGLPKVGSDLNVAVQSLAGMDDTIAITLDFATDCGDDNILLLFQRRQGGWQRILDWHSDKYTSPNDAFGDIFGFIVTPGAGGRKLIAVAHGRPWCSSNLSRFMVDLLAPATARTPQKLLAHGVDDYFRGDEDVAVRLTARADGFTLRLPVMSSFHITEGGMTDVDTVYTAVFRYRTLANRLDRQPAADDARAFVDSWLNTNWPIAARWTAPPLEPLHILRTLLTGKKAPSIGYSAVSACKQTGLFQVQLDLGDPTTASLFAKVSRGDEFFTLLAIVPDPDPDCDDVIADG